MIEMEVAQEAAYEQRKISLKAQRMSIQMSAAEDGKIVPDGGPSDTQKLYMPGIKTLL